MKKFALCIFYTFLFAVGVAAQNPTPTPLPVVVSQSFVDDAAKAFALVVALRDALQKEQMANGASAVTKAALQTQIAALNDLIVIFERKDKVYQSLLDLRDQAFVIYDKALKIQSDVIDMLVNKLNAKPSVWSKFLDGVKTVLKIVVGIAIGRVGTK